MQKDKPATITANVTESIVLRARRIALEKGKSLRAWAGELIVNHLNRTSKHHK